MGTEMEIYTDSAYKSQAHDELPKAKVVTCD